MMCSIKGKEKDRVAIIKNLIYIRIGRGALRGAHKRWIK